MKVSPARSAAFDILLRVEREKAFTSVLLPQYEENLSPADRGLCHALVLGALRKQIWLDWVIDLLAPKKLDIEVRIALRLGIFQLSSMQRVPAHAAVNESVELVVRAKRASAKNFTNAILRRYQRETPVPTGSDPLEQLSIETSHPMWLLSRWAEQYGSENAASIARANNEIPRTSFRLLTNEVEVLSDWQPSKIARGALLAETQSLAIRELQEQGKLYLQDEASQAVALAVRAPDAGSILDVCAAPGGKTGLISIHNPGSRVFAGDLHRHRTRFLRENLRSQGQMDVSVTQYDAADALPFKEGTFDAVLLDAPCSGTGTIRNNPEIRFFITSNDIRELSSKQQLILRNASKVVKPGGSLVYSTCSLEREEGEEVIGEFLRSSGAFSVETPAIAAQLITDEKYGRTFPDRHRTDGFFVAALRRRSDS